METTLLYQNGTKLYADSGEQPSLAPFLLAWFAALSGSRNTAEFCAGDGACAFWSLDRGFRGPVELVDRRPEPLELAKKTARENGFENVSFQNEDLRTFRAERPYDVILCNPPFFDERDAAEDEDRSAVRHENGLDPASLCRSVALNLKQRGHFYVCYDPRRLTDLLCAMREAGLEPKRIRFCRHQAGRDPFLVLVDGICRGGRGVSVLPDLCVLDENGNYTEQMLDVCERGYA